MTGGGQGVRGIVAMPSPSACVCVNFRSRCCRTSECGTLGGMTPTHEKAPAIMVTTVNARDLLKALLGDTDAQNRISDLADWELWHAEDEIIRDGSALHVDGDLEVTEYGRTQVQR